MAKTRIFLTGADSLTGSHILAQLLSQDTVSIRAIVQSRESAHAIFEHYERLPFASLELIALPEDDDAVSGTLENALCDLARPFDAVIHTLIPKISDEADCLSKFVTLETEEMIRFLTSIQIVAPYVRRVVLVTSLAPFARWLVQPQTDGGSVQGTRGGSPSSAFDADHVLATSQASSSTMYDAILRWMRTSGATFDVAFVSTPSVYGPTVHALETSSDLSETNRRIWNICSNEPRERTETPLYGINHYSDVRDVATASIRALFVAEASNRHFVVSAGAMPAGSQIAESLVARFPELRGRIRMEGHSPRQASFDDEPLDIMDAYLVKTVLGVSQLRSAETTIIDTVQQMLDLQRRKTWKSIIQS